MMPRPEHPDFAHQDQSSPLVWDALRRGKIWVTQGRGGPYFTFAAGAKAEVKGDASRLRRERKEHGLVLGLMAVHPCIAWADALVPVPNGMIEETEELAERTGKPVVRMYRPDNAASRYDIRFLSSADRKLAAEVGRLVELEDITSTGSTPYYQGKIIHGVNPRVSIHALSMLWRSPLGPQGEFVEGLDALTFHTLSVAPQQVPLDYESFVEAFGIVPELVGLSRANKD